MIELDGYTDLERIGHGGLGDVYRATRTSTGSTVAVKVLRDVSDESVAWHRTRRELTALVSLGGHAHVIALVELLEHAPGLVMEFAPGGSVAQLLERRGTTLDVDEVVLIGRQTASALAAAHEQGIVHRDIKPQNLLIDAYGQVKLCDFGIASLARTEEFRTRTSAISMRYASPEDLEDDGEVGPSADVYSLGATLLHLAHGAPPTLKERLAPWNPPTATDDPGHAGLDQILAECLQPDPAARPTAAELLERLEHLEWKLPTRRRALAVPPDAVEVAGPDDEHVASIDVATDAPEPGHPSDVVEEIVDDDTQFRTGRVPRAPERPTPQRRRPDTRHLVVGGVTVVAVVAAVILLTDRDADAPATPTATDPASAATTVPSEPDAPVTVDRPDGLIALDDPSVIWPLGAIGECLVQVDGVATLQSIDCGEPHDLQRFAVGALPEGATSPGAPDDAELDLAVADRCLEDAPPLPLPEMRIAQTNPTADTWRDGDRGYQCLIGVPDVRLTGSALD